MDSSGGALAKIAKVIAQGPFGEDWESFEAYQIPKWYKDIKFGIFIHWGVYSVPAFGSEWYPRQMYVEGSAEFEHHKATWGPQDKFGYKDFIPMFKAERFNPADWTALFKESGARYVVPVAEHHDGFAMYETALNRWNAKNMGPRRDVIGELEREVRDQGLVFGLSSHRAEHWWFFDGGRKFSSDVTEPEYADLYGPARPRDGSCQPDRDYLDDWLVRSCELVDKYRPWIFWFDWWIEEPAFADHLKKFAAYYYNRGVEWGVEVAINYKLEALPFHAGVFDVERGQLKGLRPLLWQTDTSVCKKAWCYVENHDYRTPQSLIHDLVDIVSKNGVLLLNVGPKPDGIIPDEQQRLLREIGQWLSVNGEAIYESRPWKIYGEGPTQVEEGMFGEKKRVDFGPLDIRFTVKGDTIYAFFLGWPNDGILHIKSMKAYSKYCHLNVHRVELVGHDGSLTFTRDEDGMHVDLPDRRPCDYAWVLRMVKD